MKVSIIGTHGIPPQYGGFETFAAHLAEACANAGIKVLVVNEKNNPVTRCPENIEVVSSSFNKNEAPIKFYRDSLMLAAGSDIILCCGVGGAYCFPKEKSATKIITNVDGLEHLRKKYTWIQRFSVFMLQSLATKRSDCIVADSNEVKGYWKFRFRKYKSKIKMISYGADECLPFQPSVLSDYRLERNGYFLVVARMVPENNIDRIINSFRQYIGDKKLVITGSLEDTSYVKHLKEISPQRVVFTGAIYDKNILDSLRQGCFIYIHGHSVGGTNPALLEAMAAGCACICHENIFNREVTGSDQVYFNSTSELAILLNLLEHKKMDLEVLKAKAVERVRKIYSWEKICSAYIELFNSLLSSEKK